MAFNPFRSFRKHQKVLFAGLTIMCMLTFVLAGSMTANWDFFHEILGWFGAGRARGAEVAKLYGKTYSEVEIRNLQQQRQIAESFMKTAVQVAFEGLRFETQRIYTKLSQHKDLQGPLMQILQAAQMPFGDQSRIYHEAIDQLQERMRKEQRGAEATELGNLRTVLEKQNGLVFKQFQHPDGTFFGGSFSLKGVLDFLIWRHQADRLGIQLTDEDLNALVRAETQNALDDKTSAAIVKTMRSRYGNLTLASLQNALRDEFRVRIAKKALIGSDPSVLHMVAEPVTPHELWQFYREQRTESHVAVLPIAVDQKAFLDKVPEPTPDELKAFFEANKNQEYDPKSDKAGFKQPARLKLEWVSAKPDSPEYRKEAAAVQKKMLAALQFAAAVPDLGGAMVPAAVGTALPWVQDLPLVTEYENEKRVGQMRAPSWTDDRLLPLHDSSLYGPAAVAATVGQLMGAGGTQGTLLAPVIGQLTTAAVMEFREHLRIGWTMMTVGYPNPFTAAAVAYAETPKEEFLPLKDVKVRLLEKKEEQMAQELVRNQIGELRTYLETHSKDKPEDARRAQSLNHPATIAAAVGGAMLTGGPSLAGPLSMIGVGTARDMVARAQTGSAMILAGTGAFPYLAAGKFFADQQLPEEQIKKHLAEVIKKYGLTHGYSSQFVDQFNVAEDPGLKPLKDAALRLSSFSTPGAEARQFVTDLFNPATQQGAYYPHDLFVSGNDKYLFWKTGAKPAYVPASLEEVAAKVKARWKFEKARQFAKEEAEKVATEARKAKGDAEKNLKEGTAHAGKMFNLYGVARLVPALNAVQSRSLGEGFDPYRIPEDRVEFPTKDFVDQLVSIKESGDVMVLHDQPEAHYYVVALIGRTEPLESDFWNDYRNKANPLLSKLEEQTKFRKTYRQEVLEQLRARAKEWITDNPDELKALEERRSGGGEAD